MSPPVDNIASLLGSLAAEIPDKDAILVPRSGGCEKITFLELERDSSRLADGLIRHGVARGDRVLLMVRPGIDFISLTFALFKVGAVAVLIDPGLGRKSVLKCVENIQPEAMVAIPLAHAARKIFPKAFRSVKVCVTVGRRWFWGGPNLDEVRQSGRSKISLAATEPDGPAAILFTSGSTGAPKGVLYTHRMFARQVDIIRRCYDIQRGEIDLPTFPLFALFGVSFGMTCVIPDMDPTRPAQVDPEKIVQTIKKYSVTNSFGSPALWDTVSRHCLANDIRLPTVKRILMAGAPVPGNLLKRFDRILSTDSVIHTPYGATEILPVATIRHREIIDETWAHTQAGKGACVGKAADGLELKIIKITDEAILAWDDALEVAQGEIGEIVARAPWASPSYYNLAEASRLAKIPDGNGFWHRMGDVGYLDEKLRLWFCGRKSHRVIAPEGVHFTIPCEAIFNCHADVKRSALVGTGPINGRRPVIVIEPENRKRVGSMRQHKKFADELLELGSKSRLTQGIRRVLFHPSFPVDIRHNAKISREKLAQWAEKQN